MSPTGESGADVDEANSAFWRSLAERLPVMPTQAQTLEFVRERWPHHATPLWRAGKLCEEAGEVIGAVIKREEGRMTDADVRQETAQVVICAMALAEAEGFDVWEAVAEEYAVATTRFGSSGGES